MTTVASVIGSPPTAAAAGLGVDQPGAASGWTSPAYATLRG